MTNSYVLAMLPGMSRCYSKNIPALKKLYLNPKIPKLNILLKTADSFSNNTHKLFVFLFRQGNITLTCFALSYIA